jgi:hypothetical protein
VDQLRLCLWLCQAHLWDQWDPVHLDRLVCLGYLWDLWSVTQDQCSLWVQSVLGTLWGLWDQLVQYSLWDPEDHRLDLWDRRCLWDQWILENPWDRWDQ